MTIQLTEKTKAICSENYDKNCGSCQLRPVCCSRLPDNTKDTINSWTKKLNILADTIAIEEVL